MRARALHVCAFGAFLLIAGCAAPPPPTSGTPADDAAIRAMGTKYAEAWNNGDVATLASMVTDDYLAVDPDGTVDKGRLGAEAREKAAAAQRAGANLKLSIDTVLLKWVGANAAAVGGTWSLAGAPAESGPTKGAWSTLVVKGADGQWKQATGLVAAYVPPPAPPAPKPAPAKGKKKSPSRRGARSR